MENVLWETQRASLFADLVNASVKQYELIRFTWKATAYSNGVSIFSAI